MSVDTNHTQSSSSSAIELIPTSATIPGTPNSPSLLPSPDSRDSFARRRLSWARADEAGPVHFPPPMNDPGPSSRPSTSTQPIPTVYALDDDPFVTIPRPNLVTSRYDDPDPFAYPSDSQARASSASLISTSRRDSSPTSSTFDDFTHLTATLSTANMNPNNEMDVAAVNNGHDHGDWRTDSEQHVFGDDTPRTRRRLGQRYNANLTPSPIQRSGTAIKRLSQGLRRVSWRVVNFAGAGLDDHIRLPDVGDQVDATGDGRRRSSADNDEDGDDRFVQPFADFGRNVFPLRGRTLCLFGPDSRVRRAMYGFLIFPCVFRPSPFLCPFV
jgi:voltage-dependent calcium channel